MRWLVALSILSGCSPLTCQTLSIDIYGVAGQPKTAGRVVMMCDGQTVLEAIGATVTTGAK